MPDKQYSLNIYLIKRSYVENEEYLGDVSSCDPYVLPISGFQDCSLYLKKNNPKIPDWNTLFGPSIDWKKYKTTTLKGLCIINSGKRIFALTFGVGRSLINPFAIEESFGFKTVLNSIDPNTIKEIEKRSISENPKLSKELVTKTTDLPAFSIDHFTDIVSSVKGRSKIEGLGLSLHGKEALKLNVRINLSRLPDLLNKCLTYYESSEYKKYFPEIDNIGEIRDKELRKALEEELLDKINKNDTETVWLSMPEIINSDDFDCFYYSGDRQKIRQYDIELKKYLRKYKNKNPLSLTKEKIKNDYVLYNPINGTPYQLWSVWNCLYTEIKKDDIEYLLIDGKWYRLDNNYIDKIDRLYNEIEKDNPEFPEWPESNIEKDYLTNISNDKKNAYCLMDSKLIQHDGRSKIEFCDLFSKNNEFIHVKRYGGSSVIGHLFNQGFVSGELFLSDIGFREKVNNKLEENFKIDPKTPPSPEQYTVWYVIGTKYPERNHIPLFARIALADVYNTLKRYRYKVKLGFVKVTND